jgi:predicted nucleotidyltransferase component of viral defense system
VDFTASGLLSKNIHQKVSRSLFLYGVENSCKIITDNDLALSFRILAKGPLNTSQKDLSSVYVDISKREEVIKKSVSCILNIPAYEIPITILKGMSIDEVCAEKVRAILTRNKSRDVFDIHYLISRYGTKFDVELVNKKLEFYNIKFDKNDFLNRIYARKNSFQNELRGFVSGELPYYDDVIHVIEDWTI